MEEDKKFYVPEIEEFHVGFEYEQKNSSDPKLFEWEPVKIISTSDKEMSGQKGDFSFEELTMLLKDDAIRCKYLDREDIISLGFNEVMENFFLNSNNGATLQLNSDYIHKVDIRNKDLSWSGGSYHGICKNKSELKRILKMIGI